MDEKANNVMSLDELDDDDLKIGEDHENAEKVNLPDGENLNQVIGYGKAGAIIIKGIHKSTKREVAIKIISKKNLTGPQIEDLRDLYKIYPIAQHHNIVRLEDFFENRENIYYCLELHSSQTLFDFINKYRNDLEE